MKLLANNERELETQIQTLRIYNQDIGIEGYAMLIMKSGKRYMTAGIDLPHQKKKLLVGKGNV